MDDEAETFAAILAKLTAGRPDLAGELNKILAELPRLTQGEVIKQITKYGLNTNLAGLCNSVNAGAQFELLKADTILKTKWPEPRWAVPGILPVGLAILAGAPKVGKSWLALQITQAVAAGGYVLGQRVEKGPVLYLALEDSPRRLKERMTRQNWPLGLDAEFMPVGNFIDIIGDLRNGGGERLSRQMEYRGYRMVTVDTLSRSIQGDQNDAKEMTAWLTPLQENAHAQNCLILLVDHHRKANGFDVDAIGDILGSTAKSAMADTVLGLYRERGKPGARLAVTGREVEEKTLELTMDWNTGSWQLSTNSPGLTPKQADLFKILEANGLATNQDLANATDRNKGAVYHDLAELEKKGKACQDGGKWKPCSTEASTVDSALRMNADCKK